MVTVADESEAATRKTFWQRLEALSESQVSRANAGGGLCASRVSRYDVMLRRETLRNAQHMI